MASNFSLDGGMVPRRVNRHLNQRSEEQVVVDSQTAVLVRGRSHVVQPANVSPSGARLISP